MSLSTIPIILGAVVAAIYILGLLLRRRHRLPTPADELHFAPTCDGWEIALYRYRPGTEASGRGAPREPILLCHGLLSNRYNVDLDEEHSLARYLRGAGFDTWVMELRGHGGSRRRHSKECWPYDWTIDDYVRGDFPAAVNYVLRATGSEKVHWVGHSLGGMILYAACALGLTGKIRSAVLTDAPGDFEPLRRRPRLGRIYLRFVPVIPPILFIPFVLVAGLLSSRLLLFKYGIHDRRTMLRVVANSIIDLGCSRVAAHLIRILERGRFVSFDGAVDYEDGQSRIHFPILQMGATARPTPERVARALIDRAPVGQKEYLRLGRADGFSEDYNHFTIHFGERVREEVFPHIADFLRRHSIGGGALAPRP